MRHHDEPPFHESIGQFLAAFVVWVLILAGLWIYTALAATSQVQP